MWANEHICANAHLKKDGGKFMATPIVLPKLGNTVESSIILQWHKSIGDNVAEGDIICEVETDKATMEVESSVSGTLIAIFFEEGDDVPVMANIAAVGEMGEPVDDLRPEGSQAQARTISEPASPIPNNLSNNGHSPSSPETRILDTQDPILRISPRARKLATAKQISLDDIMGTGPLGRIIERDIEAALRNRPAISPVAKAMLQTGEFTAPEQGSGPRGRITKSDLIPAATTQTPTPSGNGDTVEVIPLKGIRKTIARRMLESLQTTAQLTLSRSVSAQALLDLRKWLKSGPASLGVQSITINDLIMYAVAKTLPDFTDLNTLFENDTLYRHHDVNLGFAVDTPRGLVVPVIHNANQMNLSELAETAHHLAEATLNQTITPDEMAGGTFTVSNLGNLGIEVFTPVLNPPQVSILGVGAITQKPVSTEAGYDFSPHMTLSLTINHQVVDGAPGARFLQALAENLENIRDL